MVFQNVNENVFHGFGNLVIWPWISFGKVLEIYLKEFLLALVLLYGPVIYTSLNLNTMLQDEPCHSFSMA